MIALDKRGAISYYRDMIETKTITKSSVTEDDGVFCACCGNRVQKGVTVVRVAEPFARGRWAVKSHVDAINIKAEKRQSALDATEASKRNWLGSNINIHD